MKILYIYHNIDGNPRNTILEDLYAFKKYSEDDCFYLNVALYIPNFILKIKFDVIIYHYTFTALKWRNNNNKYFENILKTKKFQILKNLQGYKIAIPQDEYLYSDTICKFFKEFGVKTVFTCLSKCDYQTVYPKNKTGLEYYFTIPAGFVDDKSVNLLTNRTKNLKERSIDIGYRARKPPYWYGEFAQLKYNIGKYFLKELKKTNFKYDISSKAEDVILGTKWYNFLLDCKVMLGVESGASLHDPFGEIKTTVEKYCFKYPDATFEEVRQACFNKQDNTISLYAASPRHFECCITRTCQILVEGEYNGILKENKHYIPIKKDFSNIDEVIEKIKDIDYCQQIANNAYEDIIESGKYTYSQLVKKITKHAINIVKKQNEEVIENSNIYLSLLKVYIFISDNIISLFYYNTRSLILFIINNFLPRNLCIKIKNVIIPKLREFQCKNNL